MLAQAPHFILQPTPMRLSPVKVGFKHLLDADTAEYEQEDIDALKL